MKCESATILLIFSLATAAPVRESRNPLIPRDILRGRDVPQEHSHEKFLTSVRISLNANNPDGIVDPVFGLLGNAAAAGGLGRLTDTECLQQSTADQAFTNAKAAGDITGMTNALAYRALERNTGKVGLRSNSCTSVTAVNPEIAAVSQHQVRLFAFIGIAEGVMQFIGSGFAWGRCYQQSHCPGTGKANCLNWRGSLGGPGYRNLRTWQPH